MEHANAFKFRVAVLEETAWDESKGQHWTSRSYYYVHWKKESPHFFTILKNVKILTHYRCKHKSIIQTPHNHINTTRGWKESLAWSTSRRLRWKRRRWNFQMVCSCPTSTFSLIKIDNYFIKHSLAKYRIQKYRTTIHWWSLTLDLRDFGPQIIALPSREQVTMLSWQNL